MSEGPQFPGTGRAAFRQKSAEMAVAALFLLLGAIVVYDSLRLGARWAEDGPQAGYFPFYIGLIICVSALVNLVAAYFVPKEQDKAFVEVGQLKLVLAVLVPTAIYVVLIGGLGQIGFFGVFPMTVPGLGIYVASILFIGFFMRWLGKYPWWKIALVSIGNSVFFFVIFEVWFKIPLPKGPVEAWLGLN